MPRPKFPTFDLRNVPATLASAGKNKNSFNIRAHKGSDGVELLIYDDIGYDPWFDIGVGAEQVADFLAANAGLPVHVRINSPGGFVSDGLTMHNALVAHDGPVTTTVEGIAASSATLVAIAADVGKARIQGNASYFIHRASNIAWGNVDAMREMAMWLAHMDDRIAATYAARNGKSAADMLALMTGPGKGDGTLFSAEAALAAGLVDEVLPIRGEGEAPAEPGATAGLPSSESAIRAQIAARLASLAGDEQALREREAVAVRRRLVELDS